MGMGRVIKGRFGKPCEDCDGIIPAARLRVQPKARLCVECETFEEKRRDRSRALACRLAKANDTVIIKG
jgi:RNA polymerase-binding transcription factor DksA